MESRRFFSAVRKSVMAVAIAAITIPALAGVDPVENGAMVKYLGTEKQSLFFNVKYANKDASRFFVTIKDAEGVTLYQSAFTDVVFDKKFSLPKPESSKLVFIIRDSKNNYTESFEITTETHVVEDVLVTKIK